MLPSETVAARGLVNGGTASEAQRGDERSEVSEGSSSTAEPPRKKRKTGAALSLAALLGDDEPELMPASSPEPKPAEQALPTDEEVAARWKDLAAMYGAQPRLANALANATLQCREEDGRKVVGFSVTNEAQKKWIEERILRDLEDKFAKLTGCGRIRLEPSVPAEEEQGPRIYMPTEKAEDLMSKNEEVRKLVVDLGLDIK